jgi:hypothetical protein
VKPFYWYELIWHLKILNRWSVYSVKFLSVLFGWKFIQNVRMNFFWSEMEVFFKIDPCCRLASRPRLELLALLVLAERGHVPRSPAVPDTDLQHPTEAQRKGWLSPVLKTKLCSTTWRNRGQWYGRCFRRFWPFSPKLRYNNYFFLHKTKILFPNWQSPGKIRWVISLMKVRYVINTRYRPPYKAMYLR